MELEFIRWLRTQVTEHENVLIGPGDDAAVLRFAGGKDVVVTSDLLTDGVDFILAEEDPRRIGRKALAVNLSDLAAMAAQPVAAIVSVALPSGEAASLAPALFDGMRELATHFDVAVAGGDTNTWDQGLVISVTAIGQTLPKGPLCRRGARLGDWILATGDFGGSILGKQFDFEPRISEALVLHARYEIHAGIDVSDGLSLDLSRLATESGIGAAIDPQAIPISPAAVELAEKDPSAGSALDHALSDGEDFELLLAIPPEVARRLLAERPTVTPLTCIGRFVETPGIWELDAAGELRPLPAKGWEHGGSG